MMADPYSCWGCGANDWMWNPVVKRHQCRSCDRVVNKLWYPKRHEKALQRYKQWLATKYEIHI